MTTNIRTIFAPNVRIVNDVYNLGRGSAGTKIAGKAWLLPRASKPDELLCLFKDVVAELNRPDLYGGPVLISGHSAWVPATRINEHKKYFKGLNGRFKGWATRDDAMEVTVHQDGKLRYFSGVGLRHEDLQNALELMEQDQMAGLVFGCDQQSLSRVLMAGWESVYPVDEELLERVCNTGAILLKKVGRFDEQEIGFMALGIFDVLTGNE